MKAPTILMLWVWVFAAGFAQSAQAQEIFKEGKWVKFGGSLRSPEVGELRSLISQGKYGAAAKLGKKLIKGGLDPDTEFAVRLLTGDAYLLMDEMSDARKQYDRVLSDAPARSDFYDAALERQYELAWQWVVGGRKKKLSIFGVDLPIKVSGKSSGLRMLSEIRTKLPNDELAARTLLLNAERGFADAEYDIAEGDFGQLTERYPGTNYSLSSELQSANTLIAQFKGPQYDMEILRRARVGFQDFSKAHPAEARKRDTAVLLESIEWTFARRDYETAEFYRRTGDIRAAVQYYRYVVRDNPGTPWRERAKRRLFDLGADDFIEP